jgi:F420H(2)-dependent quinone reductase
MNIANIPKGIFRQMVGLHVLMYRLTKGAVGYKPHYMPVLLLTTTGRKTGKKRTVPVVYMEDGANYVVAASFGGNAKHPAWWLNLMASPQAMIQIKAEQKQIIAQQASREQRSELWARWTALDPNFEAYQQRTRRQIPMAILSPVTETSASIIM